MCQKQALMRVIHIFSLKSLEFWFNHVYTHEGKPAVF